VKKEVLDLMMLLFKKCGSYRRGGKCGAYCQVTLEDTCCLVCPRRENCDRLCPIAKRILKNMEGVRNESKTLEWVSV